MDFRLNRNFPVFEDGWTKIELYKSEESFMDSL